MNENEKEIMEVEVIEEPETEIAEEHSGIGTGVAMLIGSGLTLATIFVGKKLKKMYDKAKAKKELGADVMDAEIADIEPSQDEVDPK